MNRLTTLFEVKAKVEVKVKVKVKVEVEVEVKAEIFLYNTQIMLIFLLNF